MKTLLRSASIALLAIAVCAPTAGAQVVKCQRSIAKASSQFLQARVKALQKCEEGVQKGSLVGPCPDGKATASIDKARGKLNAAIGKSCGGEDKVCGGSLVGEFPVNAAGPAGLDWPTSCPNFEKGDCSNAITDCSGISECLACVAGGASDQAMDLYYDDLEPSGGDKILAKCQLSIGKATSAFLNSKSKILQKCWDARLNGKHSNPCDGVSSGDGKYLDAITKAENKKIATICKACGGADKLCNGVDDISPATIGFPSDCTFVSPPGQASCAGPITDLSSLVTCVDCVTGFKADCVDRLQVPQFGAYPTECNSCSEPPATGLCPTSLTFTADGPAVDLDTGFTGLAHNAHVPTNGRITLAVSGCDGVNQPTCGECTVNGPLANPGGPEFDTQRCQDAQWIRCTADSDCTNATSCIGGANNGALCTAASQCPGGGCANSTCEGGTNDNAPCSAASECPGGSCDHSGAVGPCIFFFGAPLPLVAGGVPTCVVNEISGSIVGTINLNDGSSTTNVPLLSKVFPVGGEFNPCPRCEGGVCTGHGQRIGQACVPNGESLYPSGQTQFGTVSLDCPPNPGSEAGALGINLNIATGTQTKTVEAGNPNCRQTGYTGLKCLCDSCNNGTAEGCSTNGDCPANGGGPGICGGLRCIGGSETGQPCRTCVGGTNHGSGCGNASVCPGGTCWNPRICNGGANDLANCNQASACPGGTCAECLGGGSCNRPGESTQPNSCADDTNTPQLEGCIESGPNIGTCVFGPEDQVCSIQTFHVCVTDADCDPVLAMPPNSNLLPGQSCVAISRSCFPDNGVIGNTVEVSGSPDVPCGGISKPTVGTFFCVAPVEASAVNAAGGLPALGRVRIPGVVDINP